MKKKNGVKKGLYYNVEFDTMVNITDKSLEEITDNDTATKEEILKVALDNPIGDYFLFFYIPELDEVYFQSFFDVKDNFYDNHFYIGEV